MFSLGLSHSLLSVEFRCGFPSGIHEEQNTGLSSGLIPPVRSGLCPHESIGRTKRLTPVLGVKSYDLKSFVVV